MGKCGNNVMPYSRRTKKRQISQEIVKIIKTLKPTTLQNSQNNNSSIILFNNQETCIENNLLISQKNVEKTPNHHSLPSYSGIGNLNELYNNISTSENESCHDNINIVEIYTQHLKLWAIEFNIAQNAHDAILNIFRKHKCFFKLPKDSRTIMQTKPVDHSKICDIEPGKFYHFGIENGVKRHLSHNFIGSSLKIGIDGLPISKSNSNQFWPILAYIRPQSEVFPIGIFFDNEKPKDSNTFLSAMYEEANRLYKDGIKLAENFIIPFEIDAFCCDTPAKSFVLKYKGHWLFFMYKV